MATAKKVMRHASGLKAHRKSLVRQTQNYEVRSRVKTLTTKVLKEVAAKNTDAAKANFKLAQSAWQKAVQKGVFHRNVASRKIANLASRVASLGRA